MEAVWELAEHRYLYIEHRPEHAGHAMLTLFLDDFDARIAQITERGLEPAMQEVYDNGVRKTTYRDPDGNEIAIRRRPALIETGTAQAKRAVDLRSLIPGTTGDALFAAPNVVVQILQGDMGQAGVATKSA